MKKSVHRGPRSQLRGGMPDKSDEERGEKEEVDVCADGQAAYWSKSINVLLNMKQARHVVTTPVSSPLCHHELLNMQQDFRLCLPPSSHPSPYPQHEAGLPLLRRILPGGRPLVVHH